jgi:hypothetical protein
MPYNMICLSDGGRNQSGGLECRYGRRSSVGSRSTSNMGDKDTFRLKWVTNLIE